MRVQVTADEASERFSQLLEQVTVAGDEVVISRGGQPIARLVPVPGQLRVRVPGTARGLVVPPGFDDPLPDDLLDAFEQ